MAKKFFYSSGQCGAGKTFGMCETAREITKGGGNVLMIQPTKLLADNTAEDEFRARPNSPLVKVFHGGTVGRGVGHQLADYLAEPQDAPQVVIATHQVLPLLTHRTNLSGWHLMVDECPQVDRCESHSLAETHEFLTRHIRIVPVENSPFGRVEVTNREALKAVAGNLDDDDLWKTLQETARILLNEHWDSWVNVKQYDKLLARQVGSLTFHSLMKPSLVAGFGSVFMAGANFEDSAIYHLWGRHGILWEENRSFTDRLQYQEHRNGHLVTVYYGIDGDWSGKKRDEMVDGISNLDRLRDAAQVILDSDHPLWQANKYIFNKRPVSDKFFKGTRLPNNPLGLNSFSGVDDIAFFSALNPTPEHGAFLRSNGLSYEQISRRGYCSTLYQAVMRTSLRDIESQNPKRIVVPDRRGAEFLCEKLPGAKIQKMETGIIETVRKVGRPKVHADNAEKSRMARERARETKRRKMLVELLALSVSQDHCDVAGGIGLNLRNETPIDLYTHFDTELPYCGTIYSHDNSALPEWYLYCADWDHFIQAMEYYAGQSRISKTANRLISPAIFDPDRVVFDSTGKPTWRALSNIVYLQNIMLDFEKGDLRPEQFADLFPDLQMVITNTWGHTSENPRFRVIIPTNRQMTADVYEAIFDEIVQRMADQGVVQKTVEGSNFRKSGLDHSKRSATSLFYLPCQAEIAQESFFDVYSGPDRQPLDPLVWIETARVVVKDDFEFIPIQPQQGQYDQTRLDAAVDLWRHQTLRDEGNRRFYLFAVELKKLGMADHEIQAKLREEARFGRSPTQRLVQIPSIMSSLAKWKPKTSVG